MLIIELSVFYSFLRTLLIPCTLTELPPLSPKSTKSSQTTRDQRRDIRLLYDIGWSYKQIHDYLPFHPEYYQIRYAYRALQATPKKKSGRRPVLTQAQIEDLVFFVYASSQNRRMSFSQLTTVMNFGVKKDVIRSALLCKGFHRRLAMRKPPISEKNRQLRLQ